MTKRIEKLGELVEALTTYGETWYDVVIDEIDDKHPIGFAVWRISEVIVDNDIELVTIRLGKPRMNVRLSVVQDQN